MRRLPMRCVIMDREYSILAIAGKSKTGKTTLITRMIRELKLRGYSVGVIKHCPKGFDLDVEGKDSWRFAAAGADGVFLSSPTKLALIKSIKAVPDVRRIAMNYLSDCDVILVEGYRGDKTLKKIEVLAAHTPETLTESLVAVVAEGKVDNDKPVFRPTQAREIIDFLEELWKKN